MEIGNNVTSIGSDAFQNCKNLTAVTIPDNVTSIGSEAFHSCTNLTAVTIPDSVTSVESRAFYGCSSLSSIAIGKGVSDFGSNAFYSCTALSAVNIKDVAAWCKISFSTSDANPLYYAEKLYLNGEDIGDLVVPTGITSIGSCAFYYCTNLTSVVLPETVTSIDSSAFRSCSNLKTVSIPDSVTTVGSYAFYNCKSLTEVKIPSKVKTIASSTFYGCTNLESVEIGNNVTSIGSDAFRNCKNLTAVTIPDSVTSIGDYAFYNCTSLSSASIGNESCSINSSAFPNESNQPITFYGVKDSTAQAYAEGRTQYNFVEIAFSLTSAKIEGATNGYAVFGTELTVSAKPSGATYLVEWYADGVLVSTDATYTVTPLDQGKQLTAKVSGTEKTIGTIRTKAVLVPALAPGDCDGDGQVGVSDLSILAQYLGGWDVVLGNAA